MVNSSRQIKVGALLSYASVAFSAIAGLIYTPWMVRTIGPSDYGLYTLAISVITFFLSDLGVGESATRFLSKYYAEGREDAIGSFLGVVFIFYFAIAAVLFVVFGAVYCSIDAIYANLTAEELVKFKDIFLIVAICSVLGVPFRPFTSVLTSNERFIALRLCNLLSKIMTVVTIVVLLMLGFDVFAVVFVNSGFGLLFMIIQMILALRLTNARPIFGRAQKGSIKELIGFSAWTLVAQVSQRFIYAIMPSILAVVTDSWAIAVFGLASQLEGYVWNVGNALNGLFMPRVSQILAGDDTDSLQGFIVKVGRIQVHVIGLVVVGFFALGGQFVSCWMGPGYDVLYPCVVLLLIPSLLHLPTMTGSTSLVAAGAVKQQGIVYLAMAIVNIVLGFILASLFGIVGACASICVAYLVRTFGLLWMYRQVFEFRFRSFLKAVYPSWILTALPSCVVGIGCLALSPIAGWAGLILNACITSAVYVLLSWTLSLNNDEKGMLKSFFPHKPNR